MTMQGKDRRQRMKTALVKSRATAEARTDEHVRAGLDACRKFECAVHDHAHFASPSKCRRPACKAHKKPAIAVRPQRRAQVSRGVRGLGRGSYRAFTPRSNGPARPPGR